MLQVKTFKIDEDQAVSEFMRDHRVLLDGGLKITQQYIVLTYTDEPGLSKSEILADLGKQLRTLQQNRIVREYDRRFWRARALIVTKSKEEQQANIELTKAGLDCDTADLEIRTMKNLIQEVEKGTFMV